MDDLARLANTAISRQRFAYAGMTALVLVAASFSDTTRRLFDGEGAPGAFTATPAPDVPGAGGMLNALPLLRSFAFHRPSESGDSAGTAPSSVPPAETTPSGPVQIASVLPSDVPAALNPAPQGVAPATTGGGPLAGVSGPTSGIVAPPNQPSTTLPVTPTGPGGSTNPPGNGPGSNPTGPGGNPTGPGGNPTGPGGNPTGPGGNPNGPPQTNPTLPVPAVPEPASWAMMLLGFASIGVAARGGRKLRRAV